MHRFGATLVVMLLGSLCKAFGQGAGTPSLQAYVVKKLPAERAGVASSTDSDRTESWKCSCTDFRKLCCFCI